MYTSAPATPDRGAASDYGGERTSHAAAPVAHRTSPTADDMAEWTIVTDVLRWIGLNGDAEEQGTPEHSLMELLGIEASTPIRELGLISAEDYAEAVADWTLDGRKPSLMLRSKAKALGHFSRVFLGLEYTAEQRLQYEEKQEAHKRACALRAATPAPAQVVQTAAPAPAQGGRVARFKDIADASRTGEVSVLDEPSLQECFQRYLTVMHARTIPEAVEPSADQLTILQALLKEKNIPYVDFALWGPYAGRIQRALTGAGLRFDADMKLVQEQYKGPPTFAHWKACWQVFQAALVMLGASTPPPLTAYAEKIEALHRQFTPRCWALIYQQEARFRQEKLVQVQRQEVADYELAVKESRSHPYDPLRPWDRCFEMATLSTYCLNYWRENVEMPAVLILTNARQLGDYLDGDASVASSSSAHIATSYATPAEVGLSATSASTRQAPTGRRPAQDEADEPPVKKRKPADKKKLKAKADQHNVENGLYVTNRAGRKLCSAYQSGKCTNTSCQLAHQCYRCLGSGHAGEACKATPKAKTGKAGGKGKGK